MRKILSSSFVIAALLAAAPAFAGGSKGAIGVGADLPLANNTLPEIAVDYDAGAFHVGGGIGAANPDGPDNGQFDISGHFYYHVASTAMADFGVGGGLTIDMQNLGTPPSGANDDVTNIYLEPGFQIRAFLASNVALSFTAGLSIGVGDNKDFFFGGNPLAAAGFRYYFD